MNVIISNSSGEPIYAQVERQIRESIISGTLQADESLPSIRLLSKELRISVITTKRAYEELEAQGFIYTVPGKGSFIAAQDKEFLKETIMRNVEEHMMEAIEESKKIKLSLDELKNILEVLYEEK